jgi:hypothetical protein
MIPELYIKNLCISKFVTNSDNIVNEAIKNITFEGPFKVIIRNINFLPFDSTDAAIEDCFKFYNYNVGCYIASMNTILDNSVKPDTEILITNATMFNSLDFRVDRYTDNTGALNNTNFKGILNIHVDIVKYKN